MIDSQGLTLGITLELYPNACLVLEFSIVLRSFAVAFLSRFQIRLDRDYFKLELRLLLIVLQFSHEFMLMFIDYIFYYFDGFEIWTIF